MRPDHLAPLPVVEPPGLPRPAVDPGWPPPPAWAGARRILAVRLDSMGDVLMTTPAIRALRETGPGTERQITLLTSPAGAEVARLVPEVDDVVVYEAPWLKATPPGAAPDVDLAMAAELRRRAFDAAVIFTVYSQSALPAAFLCHLAGIPLRLAHCREKPYQLLTDRVAEPEPERLVRHEVRRQLDLVAAVGAVPSSERLSVALPGESRDRVRGLLAALGLEPSARGDWAEAGGPAGTPGGGHATGLGDEGLPRGGASGRPVPARERSPWAVLHPGASAPSRRYPPDRFATAARGLVRSLGCRLVFTGSSGETPLVESIREAMSVPSQSLAGELTTAELAALLEAAPLLVAGNTGPVHLAAAVGTPVVDLYALTNPQHTPWGVPNRVLFHDVPCRDCYASVCPMVHHDCLRLVDPADVVLAAAQLLGLPPPAPTDARGAAAATRTGTATATATPVLPG